MDLKYLYLKMLMQDLIQYEYFWALIMFRLYSNEIKWTTYILLFQMTIKPSIIRFITGNLILFTQIECYIYKNWICRQTHTHAIHVFLFLNLSSHFSQVSRGGTFAHKKQILWSVLSMVVNWPLISLSQKNKIQKIF